jgi:hypothetical protein
MATSDHAALQRVRFLSRLFDERFRLPGTNHRFGLDGIIGLVPGVGDSIGAVVSAYIIIEALRLGIPKRMLLRMLYNMGLDTLLGAVPVVGDVFDVVWKANKKNVALLDEHLQRRIASNDVTYDAL